MLRLSKAFWREDGLVRHFAVYNFLQGSFLWQTAPLCSDCASLVYVKEAGDNARRWCQSVHWLEHFGDGALAPCIQVCIWLWVGLSVCKNNTQKESLW